MRYNIFPETYIFLISRLGKFIQPITSGNKATMSLLLMVILATIFLSAIFLAEWFLSFFPPLFNSCRNSATLPCLERENGEPYCAVYGTTLRNIIR